MRKRLLILTLFSFLFLSVPLVVGILHADTLTGAWMQDNQVTFVGKTAARAGAFLDWTLENYNWVQLGTNEGNPLIPFWIVIRNIVYAIFALFILSTAFLMIITRGRNISFAKFIPRFIGIFLLVTFSFGVVQIIYQVSDIVQGFFLRNPDPTTQAAHAIISQQNLLNVGFDYDKFIGYRLENSSGDESAAITLLLTKLTAVTYYAMSAMLIIRKIVMWFFIIISPIFPLLLFYWPIRNTAKIWIGEFFRWTLYGPLFALLLAGLVSLWSSTIPLFTYQQNGSLVTKSTQIIYPTVVNILLGGPGQAIGFTNTINLPETFALYMICLMMLWAVLILPFILLRIFLDYLFSLSLGEGMGAKQFLAISNSLFRRPPASGPAPLPLPPAPAGAARALPFGRKLTLPESTPVARTITPTKTARALPIANTQQAETPQRRPVSVDTSRTNQIMQMINLSVPTMRDIARYESTQLSTQIRDRSQVQTSSVMHNLQLVARPELAKTQTERQQYERIRERLVTESQKGNVMATNIINTANVLLPQQVPATDDRPVMVSILNNIATPERVSQITEKTTYQQIKETVQKEVQSGNPLATVINQYISQNTSQTTNQTQQSNSEVNTTQIEQIIRELAKPETITNTTERQTITLLKEEITKQAVQNNPLATQLLSLMQANQPVSQSSLSSIKNQVSSISTTSQSVVNYVTNLLPQNAEITNEIVATFVQSLANPTLVPEREREKVETIRETIIQDSAKGDILAQTLLPVVQSSQNVTPDVIEKVTTLLSQMKGQVKLQTLMNSLIQEKTPVQQGVPTSSTQVTEFVQKILTVNTLADQKEKEEISTLIEQIKVQATRGDLLAKQLVDLMTGARPVTQESVLNITQQIRLDEAKNTPVVQQIMTTMQNLQKNVSVEKVKQEVVKAKDKGDKLGALLYTMLVKQRQKKAVGQQVGKAPVSGFPVANRIQSVSIEDYEAVKRIWKDNYKSLDTPMKNGVPVAKSSYIQSDIDDITLAINLISSPVAEKRQEGMDKVSAILPFLLLGGFSQTEIIGYLKAKQEAAKDVLEDVQAKEEDEETKVERKQTVAKNTAHLAAEEELPEPDARPVEMDSQKDTGFEMPRIDTPAPDRQKEVERDPSRQNVQDGGTSGKPLKYLEDDLEESKHPLKDLSVEHVPGDKQDTT